jgi:hypothetical protein
LSGNRKQNQAKPDCGGEAKAQPKEATGRLKPLRLFSTLLPISTHNGSMSDAWLRQLTGKPANPGRKAPVSAPGNILTYSSLYNLQLY